MSKTIIIPVEFTVEEFKDLLKQADWQIDDPVKFDEHIRSDEFASDLADDLKQTWDMCNQDVEADPEMVVEKLFGGAGCSSQLEFWDDEE